MSRQLRDKQLAIGRAVWEYYRRQAISMVGAAVKYGHLPPQTSLACADCGLPASVYDHRNYTRPYDVASVCDSCNHKRGPAALDIDVIIDHIRHAEHFPFESTSQAKQRFFGCDDGLLRDLKIIT